MTEQNAVKEPTAKNVRRPGGKEIEVFIHHSQNPQTDYEVPVTINGWHAVIKRGVWVKVPEAVKYCLQDAVVEKHLQEKDERTGAITIVTKRIPRFPFDWREVQAKPEPEPTPGPPPETVKTGEMVAPDDFDG